ncbi:hypothetical protein [Henriciella sp.]|uniref:RNA polymerase sigma factor n=1 Tax=Henriciella sp. TaxID=1968823 RepID=UPI00260D72CD|nr:hypothetical protein [Henriciella sp.]
MQAIYELTAPRLYGKLLSLLEDPDLARQVLHTTYVCLWRQRHNIETSGDRDFEKIAALAHHCALRVRFQSRDAEGLASGQNAGALLERKDVEGVSLHRLDDGDRAMLKAAYLGFESIDGLAGQTGMPPEEVRSRLARLASGKGGQSDD